MADQFGPLINSKWHHLVLLIALAASSPLIGAGSQLSPELDLKLATILERLDWLATRQAELAEALQRQCGPKRVPQFEENQSGALIEAGLPIGGQRADLFHFNRLATNAVATDNEPVEKHHSGSASQAPLSPIAPDQKRLLLALGQHYESMLAGSLDTMGSLVREHLASLRLGLNKLMSRLGEQNYQYNELASRLTLLKDEVSSLVTGSQVSATGCSDQQPAKVEAIRSSNVAALSRLLSHELGQGSAEVSHRLDSRLVELEAMLGRELGRLARRLDQIDSVGQQSALLLGKLVAGQLGSGPPVMLTYNASSIGQARRWFPGSKVPGKVNASGTEVGPRQQQTPPSPPPLSCLSKTNLVRPTSCRQLRLAGANCTGQYYIFERSTIKHVYCDMNMDSQDLGGGWMVILRRIDKSLSAGAESATSGRRNQFLEAARSAQVDFNRSLEDYRAGFGELSPWAEFFASLDSLSAFTQELGGAFPEPAELRVDLETSQGHELHISYSNFSLSNHTNGFRFELGPCNWTEASGVCAPLSSLNGAHFYAGDSVPEGACPRPFGWWAHEPGGSCPKADDERALTRPVDGEHHLYWPAWNHEHEPIRKLVLKVRRLERQLR